LERIDVGGSHSSDLAGQFVCRIQYVVFGHRNFDWSIG